MKVLLAHNRYKERGGEDECQESEEQLLVKHGHAVIRFAADNAGIASPFRSALAGVQATWNPHTFEAIRNIIRRERPDVVSVHNFFPIISPSVHYAAAAERVPVVQTLHNYRLLCPAATFYRAGAICEECAGKTFAWPAVVHACYQNGRPASAAVATMNAVHNAAGTWRKKVTLFVALTEFSRAKFIASGIAPERLAVKCNFVGNDLGAGDGSGGYALFVGRLTADKGIPALLTAWRTVAAHKAGAKLLIVGDGPLAPAVRQEAQSSDSVVYLGKRLLDDVYALMGRARALVFPSLWYEGMPRVIIEAFCRGTPVLAHRLGSMTEMIQDGKTGWLADPHEADALGNALLTTLCQSDEAASLMRKAARAEFEEKYTAERNYRLLVAILTRAMALNDASLSRGPAFQLVLPTERLRPGMTAPR